MVEVANGLFLGSEDDAAEIVYGKKHTNVTHILSIVRDPPPWLQETSDGDEVPTKQKCEDEYMIPEEEESVPVDKPKRNFATLFIRANDSPKTDLLCHFERTCTFVQQGLDTGGVMVHCVYGISRSATIVLAYLMKREGRKLEVVMRNVQKLKPDIKPNEGFLGQLKLWGFMRCRLDPSYKPFKMYRLQVHSITFSNNEDDAIVEEEKLSLGVDPGIQEVESQVYYRCRKCRRLLFTEDSVLQHELGVGLAAFHPHYQQPPTSPPQDSCSSYFIEPVEWMEQVVSSGEVSGKVQCPKCCCKLGSFSWSGLQCSCGHWVTPSFQIHKSRVDDIRSLTKRKPVS